MLTMATLGAEPEQAVCRWASWNGPGKIQYGDCSGSFNQEVRTLELLQRSRHLCWFRVQQGDRLEERINPACAPNIDAAMQQEIDELIANVLPSGEGAIGPDPGPGPAYYAPFEPKANLTPWIIGGGVAILAAIGGFALGRRQ